MLAALSGESPTHVPCSFMIFTALRSQCSSQTEYLNKQMAMGLDTVVEIPYCETNRTVLTADLPGLPVVFSSKVSVRHWVEDVSGGKLLHKTYETPDGTLHTVVERSEDWPYGDEVPLFNDYVIPRARRFPVASEQDLAPLRHLLELPGAEALGAFRDEARVLKRFAVEKGLLTASGRGGGVDVACWLCGIENLIFHAVDTPEFLDELLEIIGNWNRRRMHLVLDIGVDLFIRRGWYEGTDFWSPALFERFVLPHLRAEVALAHEAGAKFGYIITSGMMPLTDLIAAAGVDVLIGIDPVQGKGVDLPLLKKRLGGRVALWGGVNGFLTVELGSEAEVAEAVRQAIEILGPDGFVLSPVDNVRDTSASTWRNVEVFIKAWQDHR